MNQEPNIIRKMLAEDVPEVMRMEAMIQSFPWTEQIFNDCIKVGYYCYILESDKQLLGYLISSLMVDDFHVLNVAVEPTARGQGFGRKLMLQAIHLAKAENAGRVLLEVRVTNQTAIKLYKSLGFYQLAIRKKYYPAANNSREDAIVMSLDL